MLMDINVLPKNITSREDIVVKVIVNIVLTGLTQILIK
jgi:hypothetical protein